MNVASPSIEFTNKVLNSRDRGSYRRDRELL